MHLAQLGMRSIGEPLDIKFRSSRREVRIRVPTFFSVVYFSRGTQNPKKGSKRALLGNLVFRCKYMSTWSTNHHPSPLV